MTRNTTAIQVVLASSSPYRKALLERLQVTFSCESPEIDEQALPGESAIELVTRLAREKSLAVAAGYEHGLIIGSDQVATCNETILTKPLTHEKAVSQLSRIRGQTVVFHTGLCVVNSHSGSIQAECVPFSVTFRNLTAGEIEQYLLKEKPYDCAGSFKSEGLGISLLEKTEGEDATALIGLPLIRLSAMLRQEGLALP